MAQGFETDRHATGRRVHQAELPGALDTSLEYNEVSFAGGDLVSTWVAKQRRAYRGLVTS